MSVLDKLTKEQLAELRTDAVATRDALQIKGWMTGDLIELYEEDHTWRTGPMCMTGAAAYASEKQRFVNWVIKTGNTTMPDGFNWSPKAKKLLRLLAEAGSYLYSEEVDDDLEDEGELNLKKVSEAISRIIHINDNYLNRVERATAWVDAAIRQVDAAIAALPQPEAASTVESATPIIDRLLEENKELQEEMS